MATSDVFLGFFPCPGDVVSNASELGPVQPPQKRWRTNLSLSMGLLPSEMEVLMGFGLDSLGFKWV